MDIAGTELGSAGAGTQELPRDVAGGDDRGGSERPIGNESFAPAEAAQVAEAVCRQMEAGELALAADSASIPAPGHDPDAFEREFRDFELELSTLVRLSLKRAFDVLASAAALLVLLPLFLLVAALIKLTDGGPIFFFQRRVGLRGQTFRMLKFRSMVIHAERLRPRLEVRNESNGPVFKMRLDPRVTRVGRFIRRYSLDELPQLINVLAGDMSIVGPRPSLPSEVARYEPWQYRRFAVRPGLTCFWQVCPRRYLISFDEWMRLDLKYVDDWSLRLDLDLIRRTLGVVLRGTGE